MLAPLTITELQNRFYLEKCAYWFAYEANAKRKMVGRFRDDDPDIQDEDKLDYAWMQLEELLNSFPYGKVEVVLKSAASSAVEKSPSYTVEWGVMPQRGGGRGAAVGSFGNVGGGNWQMFQYMLEQQNKVSQQMQNLQLEALRLEFQNKQLNDELEADNAPSMQEKLMEEGIGLVKTYMANKSIKQPQQPVHVGTLGQRNQSDQQQQPPAKEQQAATRQKFSIDASMGYIQQITDLWPEYGRMEVLRAFLALAKANKELIGAQLKQYIESNGQ